MADPGMFSQVLGLVSQGLSPQEAKAQIEQARIIEMAKMKPEERIYAGVAGATDRFAGGLGRLLGGGQEEDAMLRKASDFAAMRNQIDPTSADSLAKAAKQMYQMGFTTQGNMYAKAAQEAKLKATEISLKEAETIAKTEEKKTPEQKNAYDIVSNDPLVVAGSPQFKKNYVETLKGLTSKAITAQVDKVGVAEKSREPVYFDKATNEQFTVKDGKRIPFSGGIDQLTAKTSVSVDAKGQEAFTVELAKDDAKEVKNARGLRDAAIGELGSLQKMQQLNQQQLMSGSFATGRVGALNLLNTLGMTSGQDATKLANSEQYTKITGDLLLDKIKKLGTQPSSTDREFIAKILPQLENSPAARQELVNYLVNKANKVVAETTRLETHARKNKGLEGFVPEVPLVGQTPNVSSMSTEELLKIAKGQK